MKNKLLQRKQRSVITYLGRKELQQRFDWPSLKSVSQLFMTEEDKLKFRRLVEDPTTAVSKAVKAGRKAHAALESGLAKDSLNEAVLSSFETAFDQDLDEVWGIEEWLAHPLGLKGRFDGVGVYQGKLTLFDHKKTNKRKTKSQLKRYFDQLVAYRMAHNFLYPEHVIEQVAIFNIWGTEPQDVGAQSVVINHVELEKLHQDFMMRVSK